MKYAYVNGYVLNGHKDMKPEKDLVILTDGDKIVKIGKALDTTGYKVIDLENQYIMPGLINLHVHLPGSGKPSFMSSDTKALVGKVMSLPKFMRDFIGEMLNKGHAKTELMSGVTTLRAVGGVSYFDTMVRDKILAGKLDGPRILASDNAVTVPGGHMAGSVSLTADTPQQAADLIEKIAENKPDLVKLMITGGVMDAEKKGEPGVLKMNAEMVKACCDKAHELNMQVAAHVESPIGIKVALENGVDTIEHGAKPDRDIIELFKKRNAKLVTTISPALPYALFDQDITGATEMQKYNGQVVFEGVIDCAKECLANDILVGLGTDTGCPYVTHYDMWRELNYFHKYVGVSNSFALHTATLVNARIAGVDNITGSIDEGKCCDFVVCKKNPLDDLTALRNISMVVARGKVYDKPTVKKMEGCEVELDKFI